MPTTEEPLLPEPVRAFLDGHDLATKAGTVVQMAASDRDNRIRQAMLSVGEVLAISGSELRLALYASSRTTSALEAAGRGLITLVLDGMAHRVQLATERVSTEDIASTAYAVFRARVTEVDQDVIGYARLVHGIEYELFDEPQVLRRWKTQIALLRETR